jgi:hypothetical protein
MLLSTATEINNKGLSLTFGTSITQFPSKKSIPPLHIIRMSGKHPSRSLLMLYRYAPHNNVSVNDRPHI